MGQNSNCDNSNCDKTQIATKLKLEQNSKCDKTQIVTKLKKIKLWPNLNYDNLWEEEKTLESLLEQTFWHLDNRWDVLWAVFWDSHNVLCDDLIEI